MRRMFCLALSFIIAVCSLCDILLAPLSFLCSSINDAFGRPVGPVVGQYLDLLWTKSTVFVRDCHAEMTEICAKASVCLQLLGCHQEVP